jgi:hypothetical protein
MILLIKLLLAHMIGDFILQPASWVEAKETRKLRAYQLYLHAILHGILIMILVWDWAFLPWAVLIAFTHGVIDVTKVLLQKNDTKRIYFFAHQMAHAIFTYLIFCWYSGYTQFDTSIFSEPNFVFTTVVVFLTTPCSFMTKMFIAKWSPHTEDGADESLEDAGKYIGIFERLFVFAFVITNNWEAIGFLLAAKSVFRFGDLKENKERKLTEYILIGTLLSFGIAILAGLLYSAYLQ